MAGGTYIVTSHGKDNLSMTKQPKVTPLQGTNVKAIAAKEIAVEKEKKKLKSKTKIKTSLVWNKKFLNMMFRENNDLVTNTVKYNTSVNALDYSLNDVNHPLASRQISGDPLPQSWNQVANFFKFFRVYAVNITVRMAANQTGKDIQFVYQITDSSTLVNSISNTTLDPNVMKRGIGTRRLKIDEPTIFSKYIKLRDIEGLNKTQFEGDDSYLCQYNSSAAVSPQRPNNQIDFYMAIVNNTDNVSVAIPYNIQIEYYTLSHDYKLQVAALSTP